MNFNLNSGAKKTLETGVDFQLSDINFDLKELSEQESAAVVGGGVADTIGCLIGSLTVKEIVGPDGATVGCKLAIELVSAAEDIFRSIF